MRIHRRGVPRVVVKVAILALRLVASPWIASFVGRARDSECGTMKLGFGRQSSPAPARIGLCLRKADVNGPIRLKRDLGKHGSQVPGIDCTRPETWKSDPFTLNPCPTIRAPQRRIFIPSGTDESHVLKVGDLVFLN